MRDINLLPGAGTTKQKSPLDFLVILPLALLILVPFAVFGYIFLMVDPVMLGSTTRTELMNSKLLEYQSIDGLKAKGIELENHHAALRSIISQIESGRNVHTAILDGINALMPIDIFAASYAIEERTITMNCRSRSEEAIAYFLHDLKTDGSYDKIAISGITKNKTADGDTQDFSFVLRLNLLLIEGR